MPPKLMDKVVQPMEEEPDSPESHYDLALSPGPKVLKVQDVLLHQRRHRLLY